MDAPRIPGLPPEAADAFLALVCEAVRRETAPILARLGDRLLTQKEAAARAGCSPKTIQRREAEGALRRVPGPSRPLYHPDEIDRALASGAL